MDKKNKTQRGLAAKPEAKTNSISTLTMTYSGQERKPTGTMSSTGMALASTKWPGQLQARSTDQHGPTATALLPLPASCCR